MTVKFYPMIRLFPFPPDLCVLWANLNFLSWRGISKQVGVSETYSRHVQTVITLTLLLHYKENHRIINSSNFKYKICMFIYI